MDTDTSSLILKNRLPLTLEAKLALATPVLPFVTRGELMTWTWVHQWGEPRRQELRDWMAGFSLLRGTGATADVYALITAAARRRGRPRPQNDTWIAACCIARKLPLATLNVKDFHDFGVHHGLELITA